MKDYPNFEFVRDTLYATIFGRKIRANVKALEGEFSDYHANAETICAYGVNFVRARDGDDALGAGIKRDFVRFVYTYLKEYDAFKRTSNYSAGAGDFDAIRSSVYDNTDYMQSYLTALLFSYAFFPHHYREYLFYRSIVEQLPWDATCIEMGSGHGLFALLLLKDTQRTCECIDISPTAVEMTRFMLEQHLGDKRRFVCTQADATTHRPQKASYDFAICCGFLEHIERPTPFLRGMLEFIAPAGKIFVMLPINTPLPDHIIHLRDVAAADTLLRSGGLRVTAREIVPTESVTLEEAAERLIPIIYLAACERA